MLLSRKTSCLLFRLFFRSPVQMSVGPLFQLCRRSFGRTSVLRIFYKKSRAALDVQRKEQAKECVQNFFFPILNFFQFDDDIFFLQTPEIERVCFWSYKSGDRGEENQDGERCIWSKWHVLFCLWERSWLCTHLSKQVLCYCISMGQLWSDSLLSIKHFKMKWFSFTISSKYTVQFNEKKYYVDCTSVKLHA